MKPKIIFGIGIPLLIIISLIVLSNIPYGFDIVTTTVDSVPISSLVIERTQQQKETIIQTITITNNYFLPRMHTLPAVSLCLYDEDNELSSQVIQARYDVPFDKSFFPTSERLASTSARNIELDAYSSKTIRLLTISKIMYSYDTAIDSYEGYEFLLLVQTDNNRYCQNLDEPNIIARISLEQ